MRILLLIALVVGLTGCVRGNETSGNGGSTPDQAPAEQRTETGDTVIEGTGTVRYVELEGGFYGIEGDDGTKYDPSGLPEGFREDGLRVSFRAEPRENVMTTRMWGRVVRLVDIDRL